MNILTQRKNQHRHVGGYMAMHRSRDGGKVDLSTYNFLKMGSGPVWRTKIDRGVTHRRRRMRYWKTHIPKTNEAELKKDKDAVKTIVGTSVAPISNDARQNKRKLFDAIQEHFNCST